MRARAPGATLFPYTTLFRSCPPSNPSRGTWRPRKAAGGKPSRRWFEPRSPIRIHPDSWDRSPCHRSEEHTSELQSHSELVCRLLLEKKKVATCGKMHNTLKQ